MDSLQASLENNDRSLISLQSLSWMRVSPRMLCIRFMEDLGAASLAIPGKLSLQR
jgi:hypothetical protein